MEAAVDFLAGQVSSALPQDAAERCVIACISDESSENFGSLIRGDIKRLLVFAELVCQCVPPDKDVTHPNHPRFDAHRFREGLLQAIEKTGAPEAVRWLERLASKPWVESFWGDMFRYRADACAARSGKITWRTEDALYFIEHASFETMAPNSPYNTPAGTVLTYQFPRPLIDAYCGHRLAVLVGSGLSLASDVVGNFPKWIELPERLLQQAEYHSVLEPSRIKAKRDFFRASASYLSLDQMLVELDSIKAALRSHRKYRTALTQIFRPANAAPGDVHRALIDLKMSIILTTNYDKLIELAEPGGTRDCYTWKEADKMLSDVEEGRDVLFKIHGTVERDETVIMTQAEYTGAKSHESYQQTMHFLLQSRTFLMVGYGMNDPYDLDPVLCMNADAFGASARTHYALMKDPSPNDRDRWQRDFNVQILPYKDFAELPAILRALRAAMPAAKL
jgi:hypothetical protein